MLTEERYNKIMSVLSTNSSVSVAELTEITGASESTIRRDLLTLAKMEPLYPKNPVEAAIIWAINDVILNSEDGELYQDGSSYLCREVYARLWDLDQPGFELILEDLKGGGMGYA